MTLQNITNQYTSDILFGLIHEAATLRHNLLSLEASNTELTRQLTLLANQPQESRATNPAGNEGTVPG